MIRLLCNRMFCCIFGKWTPTGSGSKPEVDPNRKWIQPEVGANRKWTPTGSGSKPEVDPNWKDAQNISWTQTGKINRKPFHLSALELFCCLPLWKTELFVSSRAFLLSTPTFLFSTSLTNREATWKKATKCNKNFFFIFLKRTSIQHFHSCLLAFSYHVIIIQKQNWECILPHPSLRIFEWCEMP